MPRIRSPSQSGSTPSSPSEEECPPAAGGCHDNGGVVTKATTGVAKQRRVAALAATSRLRRSLDDCQSESSVTSVTSSSSFSRRSVGDPSDDVSFFHSLRKSNKFDGRKKSPQNRVLRQGGGVTAAQRRCRSQNDVIAASAATEIKQEVKQEREEVKVENSLDSDYCAFCHLGHSEPPNQIVICDTCNKGYHQFCHKPRIVDYVLRPNVRWHCRVCVPEGSVRLSDLHWDSLHRVNEEDIYCYCGYTGLWKELMLQCGSCEQWFHQSCISIPHPSLLYGDVYYGFLCAHCSSSGAERMTRLPLSWLDMCHLVIYNMHMERPRITFFDLNKDILPYMRARWEQLGLPLSISSCDEQERSCHVTYCIRHCRDRFDRTGSKVPRFALRDKETPPTLSDEAATVRKIWLEEQMMGGGSTSSSSDGTSYLSNVSSSAASSCTEDVSSEDVNLTLQQQQQQPHWCDGVDEETARSGVSTPCSGVSSSRRRSSAAGSRKSAASARRSNVSRRSGCTKRSSRSSRSSTSSSSNIARRIRSRSSAAAVVVAGVKAAMRATASSVQSSTTSSDIYSDADAAATNAAVANRLAELPVPPVLDSNPDSAASSVASEPLLSSSQQRNNKPTIAVRIIKKRFDQMPRRGAAKRKIENVVGMSGVRVLPGSETGVASMYLTPPPEWPLGTIERLMPPPPVFDEATNPFRDDISCSLRSSGANSGAIVPLVMGAKSRPLPRKRHLPPPPSLPVTPAHSDDSCSSSGATTTTSSSRFSAATFLNHKNSSFFGGGASGAVRRVFAVRSKPNGREVLVSSSAESNDSSTMNTPPGNSLL